LELARMLEGLHLKVVILSEQPEKGRTVIEKLEQETMDIGYAFVILTPDDVGMESVNYDKAKSEKRKLQDVGLRYRARQNVVLELGYFVGKIGRRRVYCLYKGDIERPSDIHGVIFKRFEKSISECYEAIIKELSAVGYDIKI
jgi:predicted nucleotide-binding protein